MAALARFVIAVCVVLGISVPASAEDIFFFRIGTGSTGGTYFPVGGIIASAISKPPGSRECEAGGSCGVPGLIAVAQSTEGSVANILGIADGTLESGFSQADITYWAYKGEGIFKDRGPITGLRTIANLFPESVHIVVRRNAGIHSVADLRGKRVSIDREGSGTRVDALLILKAYGLTLKDIEAVSVASGDAADMLREGTLDAFIMVVGTPGKAVADLAEDSLIDLVPVTGPPAERLMQTYPFFSRDRIRAGTYFNVAETETVSVGAQWLVSARMPESLIYGITRALWHPNTRRLLDSGHPKGKQITLASALDGLVVPLHPGARRYYLEAGLDIPDLPDPPGGSN
ncbi:MAG: TAXI family TRAP transporter solute-binding subunit [Alphaproteobacteria bacterium]|nr:MAG: TAXI family TRAP transporter solute-binding subunit [Alphaproteobacteria bacterium]